MYKRLCYVSRRADNFPETGVEDILSVATQRNREKGITGFLVYTNTVFYQLLEGPPELVSETFTKIKLDPRHKDVMLSYEEYVPKRLFADWAMRGLAVQRNEGGPNMEALARIINDTVDHLEQEKDLRQQSKNRLDDELSEEEHQTEEPVEDFDEAGWPRTLTVLNGILLDVALLAASGSRRVEAH